MNKTVTITGSTGALGVELAKIFYKSGFSLIAQSRKKKILLPKKQNQKINYVIGDLENKNTLKKLNQKIIKQNSSIIINNAGLYLNKSFSETTIIEIKKLMNINFFINLNILKNLVKTKKKYLIININSIAGLNGSAAESIYCASKHALKGFYDSIEQEPDNNFNIINIFPGAFKSKITKKRKDYNNLMDPSEIAEVIFKNIKNYNSLKVNNIFLKRKNY